MTLMYHDGYIRHIVSPTDAVRFILSQMKNDAAADPVAIVTGCSPDTDKDGAALSVSVARIGDAPGCAAHYLVTYVDTFNCDARTHFAVHTDDLSEDSLVAAIMKITVDCVSSILDRRMAYACSDSKAGGKA